VTSSYVIPVPTGRNAESNTGRVADNGCLLPANDQRQKRIQVL